MALFSQRVRTVAGGAIGNVLEWYDFALFGYFAPIIGRLFFPDDDPLASLLQTFGVFAVGFLMRPVGGLIFGHIGDRLGRKRALEWSVLLMAGPTTLIGLLPAYDRLGELAPILLTLIRILQGISVGGEFIGSMSFLGEHATDDRRGLHASWSAVSATAGVLLGSAVAALANAVFPHDQLAAYGWRIPFLMGVLVAGAGLWLRLGVDESPSFTRAAREGEVVQSPLWEAVRTDRAAVVRTCAMAMMMATGFYLPFVWIATWLSDLHRPRLPQALTVNSIAMTALLVFQPLGGWLSDRLGRRKVMLAGALIYAVLTWPLFRLLEEATFPAALAALLVYALGSGLYAGPACAVYAEQFPTRTRYSGIAIGYNFTLACFGGTTPFVATGLLEMTGSDMAPAAYLIACSLVSVAAVLTIRERHGQPLD